MKIENVPEAYLASDGNLPDIFVYDFKLTKDSFKSKVNLNMHMFSFLQFGEKQVHFSDTSVAVDSSQSLLIKKGNCLWSELISEDGVYYCKLLFFSEERLRLFLKKYLGKTKPKARHGKSCFSFENDAYLKSYLDSLSNLDETFVSSENLFSVKFDELLLYLLNKYPKSFEEYLLSLIQKEESLLKNSMEEHIRSALSLEEIAFLSNMSLSTFKRTFIAEYGITPGKWFRKNRLLEAKKLLETTDLKPSQIFMDFGYRNLSNFSSAFKTEFGKSPSEIK